MKRRILIAVCFIIVFAFAVCISGCGNNYGGMTQEEADEMNQQMVDELLEEGVVPDQDGDGEPITEVNPDDNEE